MVVTLTINVRQCERMFRVITFGAFFVALCSLMPWEAIRGAVYPDIANYITRFERIENAGFTLRPGRYEWWQIYLDEPVWRLIGVAAVDWGVDYYVVMKLVTAFTAAIFFIYSSQRVGPILSGLLLTNSMVFDLLNAQLRSAFAMALLLLGLMTFHKFSGRVLTVLFAGGAHTSILAIAATRVGVSASLKLRSRRLNAAVWVLFCAVVGCLGAALLMPYLLGALGKVQYFSGGRSLSYSAFWAVLSIALTLLAWTKWASPGRDYLLVIALLVLAVIGNAFGLGLMRLVPMAFPLIINSLADMKKLARQLTAAAIGGYSIVLWGYWLAFSA